MLDFVITKIFTQNISIPENKLHYTKFAVLGKSTVHADVDNFSAIGSTLLYNETNRAFLSISFKELGNSEYQIIANIGIYLNTSDDTLAYFLHPVDLYLLVSYMNNQGHYEIRKYKT